MGRLKSATETRFNKRNATKRVGRKRRVLFCQTPVGERFTSDQFIDPLAEFLAGKNPEGELPNRMPKGLGEIIIQLDAHELAVVTLTPLLNAIYAESDGRHTGSADIKLRLTIGKYFFDKLAMKRLLTAETKDARKIGRRLEKGGARKPSDWRYLKSDASEEQKFRAGDWLLEAALRIGYFMTDADGFTCIRPDFQRALDDTREEMMLADPAILPHLSPPPDWTSWRAVYEDRIGANFVRDWRLSTKKAIEAAFTQPDFEHARGVSNLQRVAFKIDPTMAELAEQFAVQLMEPDKSDKDYAKKHEANKRLVINDVAEARALGGVKFWLTYNCDSRGRVYPIPHLNYAREDHVRALFRFAEGLQLTGNDITQLEIHCANSNGRDKDSFRNRIAWARENHETIKAIAADPFSTFETWRHADEPLRYVAACREVAGAWRNPQGFVTQLPIGFDGSCNGVQHLALLSGRRVNLIDSDDPQDIYGDLAAEVIKLVKCDQNERANAWREFFALLDQKKIRKLIKRPAMTYGYGATLHGMKQQIQEAYDEIASQRDSPPPNAYYLAKKVKEAAEKLLQGPAVVMKCLQQLTGQLADKGKILQWTSPTGFPVSNDYRETNIRIISIRSGGIRVRHKIADGCLPKIRKGKAVDSAPPNFVHSLDAAHLIRVVNRANTEGIKNLITVHDSFACLAPQAERLGTIIRSELAGLYALGYGNDHLGNVVRHQSESGFDGLAVEYGDLKPDQVLSAKYSFG